MSEPYISYAYISEILNSYIKTPEVQSMRGFIQHGSVTTYDHCMSVALASYRFNKRYSLGADEKQLVIGAFLHDFYLYDWHTKDIAHRLHGFTHAQTACANAERIFDIGDKESKIILSHMWPLTFRRIPKCREAVIVCIVDKICSLKETFLMRNIETNKKQL